MASVSYFLKRANDSDGKPRKEPVTVYVTFTIDRRHRFELPTGEKIPPKFWDKNKQGAKAQMPGHVEFNQVLSRIKDTVIQLYRDHKHISIIELKEKSRLIIKHGSAAYLEKKTNDFELFIEDFILKCRKGLINRTPSTIQVYQATFDHLKAFSKAKKYPLSFDAVNMDFFFDFRAWSWDVQEHSDSTVHKSLKTIKTWLKIAMEFGLHDNKAFMRKQINVDEGEADSIYLTEDEILKIYNLDLSDKPHLVTTRDLFVFACWVGLRYSDFSRIQPHHVTNGNLLRIITQKTKEEVVIPFHPIAREIYRKYNYNLPESDSNPEFNWKLKDIAAAAELNEVVQCRNTIRGKVEVEYCPKHQMVVAHTARRSFATNCYKMGIPVQSIMAITGHRTEKAFKKYIKLTKEEHAAIVLEAFNKQPLLKIAT